MSSDDKKGRDLANGADASNHAPDPSEADPCMEKKSRGRARAAPAFVARRRDRFAARTGLSARGVYVAWAVLFALLASAVAIVVLIALWPRVPHKFKFPACARPGCLRAAAQIQGSMDHSVSPCDDVWNFTCGKWLLNNPLPPDRSEWNIKEQLKENEIAFTRDAIATLRPETLRAGSVESKMKKLYESCMQFEILKGEDVQRLKEIIHKLNGWYILRTFNKYDFDVDLVLTQLHAKYGASAFFEISVEANGHAPGQNIIRIAPAGLGLPTKEYYFSKYKTIQDAYMELIRDTVMNMDTTLARAEEFAKNMFFYEKRIADVTPNVSSLRDPIATNNVVTLIELKDAVSTIPFIDILAATFPESNISDQTEVVVSSIEYLTHIAQIISTTDANSLNGYLVWTLVRKFLPYLSTDFTKVLDRFNQKLYGEQESKTRWKICSEIVNNVMGLAIASLEEQENPLSEETNSIVNNTFTSIVSLARNKINRIKPIYPDLYRQLDQKLATLHLQIGHPKESLDSVHLKAHYQPLQVLKSDFFQNMIYSIQFRRKLEGDALNDKLASMKNIVSVPRSYLKPLFFENNFPRSYIYAHVGLELAKSVVDSMLPYGSFWTTNKRLLTKFHMTVNNSRDLSIGPQNCLATKISTDVINTTDSDIKNEIALNLLKELTAINLAYEALMDASVGDNHFHVPSLEDFEKEAIYFIAVTQVYCTNITIQKQLYKNNVNFELSNRDLISFTWNQLKPFSESFSCSFDKNEKCQFVY